MGNIFILIDTFPSDSHVDGSVCFSRQILSTHVYVLIFSEQALYSNKKNFRISEPNSSLAHFQGKYIPNIHEAIDIAYSLRISEQC